MNKVFTFLLIFSIMFISCTHSKTSSAKIEKYIYFESAYIDSRNVEVWLPPNYDSQFSYPVLYMHDGQNVFNPKTSYAGIAWEVDKALEGLLNEDKINAPIVVAIWNTPLRMQEYMPNKPEDEIVKRAKKMGWEEKVLSDYYLKFIVEELKPFIDEKYATKTSPEDTFIMGSSMGGLISFYAMAEYPHVFGGAACISTHWPALDGVFLDYVKNHTENPKGLKVYFDFGTETLDASYEPYQNKVDEMMRKLGYKENVNWKTLKFEGAEHSESDWRERVHIPLEFLFEKK